MKPARIIVLTWLAWAIIVIAFQGWMSARITPQWPDRSLSWTTDFTGSDYQQGQKYLLEPFMNNQVAWDSEYYLAIGVGGYDDPATDLIGPPDNQLTLSYSFLPFYPLLIRLFAIPLSLLGLNSIATGWRSAYGVLPDYFSYRFLLGASVYRGSLCWAGIRMSCHVTTQEVAHGRNFSILHSADACCRCRYFYTFVCQLVAYRRLDGFRFGMATNNPSRHSITISRTCLASLCTANNLFCLEVFLLRDCL